MDKGIGYVGLWIGLLAILELTAAGPAMAQSCAATSDCPIGTVCSDSGFCTDDSCADEFDCPIDHFCPVAGPADAQRHCAFNCALNSDCRSTETCKYFAESRACAVSGSGLSGEGCTDFSDCGGQRACHLWNGGYCARLSCSTSLDCEADTFCATVQEINVCVRRCGGGEPACREAEGYVCAELAEEGGTEDLGCVLLPEPGMGLGFSAGGLLLAALASPLAASRRAMPARNSRWKAVERISGGRSPSGSGT